MKWPDIDEKMSFEEAERKYRITREYNDVRPEDLGYPASKTYYGDTRFWRMVWAIVAYIPQRIRDWHARRIHTKFEKVAARYVKS